ELLAVVCRQPERRFDAFLPPTVNEQPLLMRQTQVALVPGAIRLQHTELGEQLAHERRALVRNRHVVRTPRVRRRFVLAGSRVAARLRAQFEQPLPIWSKSL